MTLRELLDAIDREAEKALIGHRLDLDADIEVKGIVPMRFSGPYFGEVNVLGGATRLERVGGRVILHFGE